MSLRSKTKGIKERKVADRSELLSERRNRKLFPGSRGHTLIELSMLSILFVVMGVLCLDVGYLIMGSELNDRACRDAARAAAAADNYTTSLQLARAAVVPHAGDGYFVSAPQVDTTAFTYQDFSGNPPTNISPYVRVTTHCNIRVPAPIFFLGTSFLSSGTMQFTRTYVFPIVKTQLYLP
jgi:Flp pilus assembly protein TadG